MTHKNKYNHINAVERKEIALLLEKGYSLRDVGRALDRSPSSISDEIRHNSVNGSYDAQKAQHKAYLKRKYSKYEGMKIVEDDDLRSYVEKHLADDWSPEEISGRLKNIDRHIAYASFRAIYKFVYSVYGRNLEQHLRYNGKEKKGGKAKASGLTDRTFIDQRPKIVEKRRRFGDWEGDLIVSGKGGKGVLVVLHERKARYALIKRIVEVKIENIHQHIFGLTGGVIMNTLTLDNDIVFKKHKELSELTGVDVYFCRPYHSWEKGGVENTNKLIRQYISKKSDISQYSDEYIQMIQDKLNNRPRKCLNYKTPLEVMRENNQLKHEIDLMVPLFFGNPKIKSAGVRLGGSM